MTRVSSALSALLALALLAGCGGGSADPDAEETTSPTATETATDVSTDPAAYLPVPEGVSLTQPGTQVKLGKGAVLAWKPRQDEVAVVDLTVERIDRTSFKESFTGWQVDKQTARQTPYFAHLAVENVSDQDLGGLPLPLYATDGGELLIEPTGFQGEFEPCPGGPLPKKFKPGDKTELCLVFMTDEADDLEGISFLPAAGLEPITWSGQITEVGEKLDRGGKKQDRKGDTGDTGDTGDRGDTGDKAGGGGDTDEAGDEDSPAEPTPS